MQSSPVKDRIVDYAIFFENSSAFYLKPSDPMRVVYRQKARKPWSRYCSPSLKAIALVDNAIGNDIAKS